MKGVLRRDFLRAVVVAATPGSLIGCGDSESLGTPRRPTGREGSPHFPQSVASGDPRPNSVVLWTRVEDESLVGVDLSVELEVSLDEAFAELLPLAGGSSLALTALAGSDGALKVRLESLEPGTTYFYRFTYVRGDERFTSRTGRTKTAPDPDADEAVPFAVVACQDFDDKYFHLLRHAAQAEHLAFVLHLGDYVYETTAASEPGGRRVRFRNPDGALDLGDGRLAARSLDNYRDLYKTYRSDRDLQRLHELFPFIVVPDDHEFSNDCHGATANYTDGRENEQDLDRRRNADQAWFEFMPFDDVEPPARALRVEDPFPDDLRLFRSFVFGRHLELVLTDLRRYRPDHLVPENAFPGSVFLPESELSALVGDVPEDAAAYVDIDAEEHAGLREELVELAEGQGFDGARVTGLVSVPWINTVFTSAEQTAPLDEADAAFARGYAYHQLLKTAEFAVLGARYLVAEAPFLALARQKHQASSGATEAIMGAEQRSWFTDTLKASTRTWKVWGNEYTLMKRVIDLRGVTLAPPEFQHRILLTVEDWDGAPNERDALLTELAEVENLAVFTGDLHALFAGTPYPEDDPSARVVEFVFGSVSSTTWLTGIQAVIASGEGFPPEAALLASLVGPLLQNPDKRPNPHIGFLDLQRNGYALATAHAERLEVELVTMDDTRLRTPPVEGASDPAVVLLQFRVQTGTRELEQRISGEWRTWDRDAMAWQ